MTLYLYRKWQRAVTQPSPSAGVAGAPAFGPIGCKRGQLGAALLALILAMLSPAAAQWRAPRPERTTARALGVLEIFPNGARRLVPVTLFYERRYFDAAYYRAAPVPLTLSVQTVYEVQHFGKPLGTFTLWKASIAPEGFWVGAGVFRTAPDPETLAKAKKSAAPVALEDPTRPVLHRREGSEGDRPVAKKSEAAAGAEDPERPRLQRKGEATDSLTGGVDQEANRAAGAANASADASQDSAADHPVLRRGKPVQEQSGSDLPSQAETRPEPVQRQVAVSDAGPSESRELLFALSEAQRTQMTSAARELARSELLRLAPLRGLRMLTPPAKAGAAPAAPEINFEDEQFVPYDLEYKNHATVVFSARYRSASSPPGGAAKERGWVVTVVARQDEDKLVKLYSALSDPRELDLYPELRLVDAVDPEGYGRFALLFREQKREGVSWLLGRVTGYELQTVFETAPR
jgi:hypothetical protein